MSSGCHSCVSVTGSHNPPDYNGLKMVIGGETLALDAIQQLKARIEAGNLLTGSGTIRSADIRDAYVAKIVGDVKLARPMKIVMDCGNGVAGGIAPALFKTLGCELVELFCEVDGNFPEPPPRPVEARRNLQDVIRALKGKRCRDRASPSTATATASASSPGRRDHLPRPPADAVRRRRALARAWRRDHLRRQMHAPARSVHPASAAASRRCGRPATR